MVDLQFCDPFPEDQLEQILAAVECATRIDSFAHLAVPVVPWEAALHMVIVPVRLNSEHSLMAKMKPIHGKHLLSFDRTILRRLEASWAVEQGYIVDEQVWR